MTGSPVVVPEGKDALDDLTVRELDIASRKLKVDVADAVKHGIDGKRYLGLAMVAWLWAKRADPRAQLDTFLDLSFEDLADTLGFDDDAGDDDELPGVDLDEDDDPDQEEANPTEPAPGS